MMFGFIAHPTSISLKRHVKLVDFVTRLSHDLHSGYASEIWQWQNLVPFVDLGCIVSATGSTCEGLIYYLPLTAEEIFADIKVSEQRVLKGIETLRDKGASLVGLGGATSMVGAHGLSTKQQACLPVTSGNSLTAFSAYQTFLHVLRELQVVPERTRIAVVGYPGSIALALVKLLLRHGCEVDLVHRRGERASPAMLDYLPGDCHKRVTLIHDIEKCYADVLFFVGASSTGNIIDPMRLQSGSVVIDVALPRDVIESLQSRPDVLIIDGGYISGSDQVRMGTQSMALMPTQQLNGCIAETLILSLENRAESFSIGRQISIEKVLEIGNLAEHHGFRTLPLTSYGERIGNHRFAEISRYHTLYNPCIAVRDLFQESAPAESGFLQTDVLNRFRKYVNPVMVDFMQLNRTDRVFVKGQGCTLMDTSGSEYLDFVAGYGCLNLGHNHPAVVQTIEEFLAAGFPTFVQYVSIPSHSAFLAERLCSIAPGNMGRVFFSNSGTEAVEAALKLARSATGRPRILYAENSYHGKTLGALSVTGKETHRRSFYPLMPGCKEVRFGDVEALAHELSQKDVAGFIIEPIQGEGGVRVAPQGYLAEAQSLCQKTGTLFIVDEVQTGFGRTGRMFACEWEGIEPDILCLAKSLSGGLVPIGATLSRSDVWDAAYGTVGKFALHTSTFGGGNLASAVGLAVIEVLERENYAANARELGVFLKQELENVAKDYPFVRDVRGKGLMLAVEFVQSFDGGICATAQDLAARLPGNWLMTYRFLCDEAREHLESAARNVERSLADMFCLRVVAKLGQDHNILTFMTANQAKVMRIQPPLVLTHKEAARFVHAFKTVCADMATFLD